MGSLNPSRERRRGSREGEKERRRREPKIREPVQLAKRHLLPPCTVLRALNSLQRRGISARAGTRPARGRSRTRVLRRLPRSSATRNPSLWENSHRARALKVSSTMKSFRLCVHTQNALARVAARRTAFYFPLSRRPRRRAQHFILSS